MKHSENTFTTEDGLTLFEQDWRPSHRTDSAVAIVHGYGEYSGRYRDVAAHLVHHGHAVFAFDLRGHGQSEGEGTRTYVRSFNQYASDLRLFLDRTRRRATPSFLFVFGHSMGGLIAAYLCLCDHSPLAGVILSSPAVLVGEDLPRPVRVLGRWVAQIAPKLPTIRLDIDALSRSSEVVAQAKRDPLYYSGRMPARTGDEILRAAHYVRAHAPELSSPLLLFHGTADRIANPEGSRLLYERAGTPDKTLRLFDGFYHESFKDPGGEAVLDLVSGWMAQRITPGRTSPER